MKPLLTAGRLRASVLLLLLLLSMPSILHAQSMFSMKKPYSGAYSKGATSAVHIFDNGQFAIIAYATFLTGHYTRTGKNIRFEVTTPKDAFMMIGRRQPGLNGRTKLTFNSSFAGVPALIQFDAAPLQLVFDKTTNHIRPHYEVEIAQRPAQIALTLANPEMPDAPNTVVFSPPAAFNDFLLFYNEPSPEEQSFEGVFEQEAGETVLNFGGDQMPKTKEESEELSFVQEAMESMEQHKNDTVFYFNDQLKSATGYNHLSEQPGIFTVDNYMLDVPSNKFIRKDVYKAGTDYSQSVAADYHDETYMIQYHLVRPFEKKKVPLPKDNPRAAPLMKADSE